MRRHVATAVLLVLSLGGAADAQGPSTVRSFPAAGFDRVDLTGSDDVIIRTGPGFSVRAEGPAAVLDRLLIERNGGTLVVARRRGPPLRGGARVFVTMPRITGARLSGSGNLALDRVQGARIAAELTGSGDLRLGSVAVDQADLTLTGSGSIAAAGQAARLRAVVTGSGDIAAGGLVARGGDVTVSGSGSLRARIDGPARVTVTGSGDVDLGPGSRCTVQRRGSGSVRCGG